MEYWVSLWKHKKKSEVWNDDDDGAKFLLTTKQWKQTPDKMPSHTLTRVSNHALSTFFFFLISIYQKQFKFPNSPLNKS